MVGYWAKQGFTSFKAYTHITREQLAAAVDEAHNLKLKIAAHLCSVTYREAASLGVDQIEHGFFTASDFYAEKQPDVCPDFFEQLKNLNDLTPNDESVKNLFHHLIKNDVVITSTLEMLARMAQVLPPLPDDVTALLNENSLTRYQSTLANLSSGKTAELLRKAVKTEMILEEAFWRAGGKLVVGTDPTVVGTLAGYGSLSTIELLVKAGISPLGAIKIATQNGAEAMGVADDRGTIAPGKRADLIVINGNPATNIKDIHNIEIVFKDGIGYDPVALKNSVVGSIGGPG